MWISDEFGQLMCPRRLTLGVGATTGAGPWLLLHLRARLAAMMPLAYSWDREIGRSVCIQHMDATMSSDRRCWIMNLENEPEMAELLERTGAPAWVITAAEAAMATDEREASAWSDSLALAIGRRANRLLRERYGVDATDR